MLTLKRFAALAASYGGDMRRWPDETRGEAQVLMNVSSQAREIFSDAQKLDSAIEAASLYEDRLLLPEGKQQAALARLRAGVATRIVATETDAMSGANANRRSGSVLAAMMRLAGLPQFRWAAGMATAGGVAILAGLWLGGIGTTASATDTVLTLLQRPPSIQILAD
jgi:hypothetical protein